MLCCFGGDDPANEVRATSMAPWIFSFSMSSTETSGSVTETGRVTSRSAVSAFAITRSTVFSTSSDRPSLLSRRTEVTPFCQLKRAFSGSCSTSLAIVVAQVLAQVSEKASGMWRLSMKDGPKVEGNGAVPKRARSR